MRPLHLLFGLGLALAPPAFADDPQVGDGADLGSLTIEQLMRLKVVGASLHPQTLADAPASVTVITADEIRKYGYRTLGEALASARGFYTSNNRTYETLGVRGFNLPGDYGSRILVLVNGHNMADNVLNYLLLFDEGFPVEMNLVKQIEIIRGPSSALYGSNGMFATINVITKAPEEVGGASFSGDFGSFGEQRGQVAAASSAGPVKLSLSGTFFRETGETPLYFPAFNNPQDNDGLAIGMDGERGYHFSPL